MSCGLQRNRTLWHGSSSPHPMVLWGGAIMKKGGIYTDQKCSICGSNMKDNKSDAVACPNHPAQVAWRLIVRYGKLSKRYIYRDDPETNYKRAKLTLDANTVICRFCSRSQESRKSFCPAVWVLMMPAAARRLSESVVFPWSTCAMMLVLRMICGLFISLTISSVCL